MSHIESEELVFFASDDVAPSRSVEIREHLSSCAHCSDILRNNQIVMSALKEPNELLLEPDMISDIMSAIEQDEQARGEAIDEGNIIRPPKGFWARAIPAAILVAAASIVGVVVAPQFIDQPQQVPEFRIKANTEQAPGENRLVGLFAYRLSTDGKPIYLQETMKAADSLLFSYANRSPNDYRYMMVFALDSQGKTHWYYPAHPSDERVPRSIPIQSGKTGVELNEQIKHPLSSGALTIYGIFSKEPQEVLAIEALIEKAVEAVGWKTGKPIELPISTKHELRTLHTRVE